MWLGVVPLRSLILGAFVLAIPLAASARADTFALVPHRAIYDIGLKSAEQRSGISDGARHRTKVIG